MPESHHHHHSACLRSNSDPINLPRPLLSAYPNTNRLCLPPRHSNQHCRPEQTGWRFACGWDSYKYTRRRIQKRAHAMYIGQGFELQIKRLFIWSSGQRSWACFVLCIVISLIGLHCRERSESLTSSLSINFLANPVLHRLTFLIALNSSKCALN